MALLTAIPNPVRIGQPVTIVGEAFAASTATSVRIDPMGFATEITTNAGGVLSNDLITEHATATLTSSGVANNAETVTIGTTVYTLKTALSTGPTVAYEVLIGANASATLDNLKSAINGTAGEGTTYSTGTVAHPDVLAGQKTATTVILHANLAGTAGNSIATTETMTNFAFGGGTMSGGAADTTGYKEMDWRPAKEGTYTVTANDGTNTASVRVQVYAGG